MPGMGMPTPEMIHEMLPGLPRGYLPPGTPGGARKAGPAPAQQKVQQRKKNKQAKAARRKQRKK